MKSLALTCTLVLALSGCTATVKRDGEVLFLYCTVFCILRIDAADTEIESRLRKALPSKEDHGNVNGP